MQDPKQRIKVAVQKSGRLADHSLELLQRCGLKYSCGHHQLICYGENMPVDVLLVRDDDIPGLVREDVCDLGIVGQNILEERRLEFLESSHDRPFQYIHKLDFGQCRLCIARPESARYRDSSSLSGKRIATSYPRILKNFLLGEGVSAEVVLLSGAVEIAPSLGRADFVCDLTCTGATLAANHLVEAETLLESIACLIQTTRRIHPAKAEWINKLLQRIKGVLQVNESKYIMLHAPRSALAEITRLLPGSESPSILPLEGRDDKVAVHAVCREHVFWETLESLKRAGASSMLVLPVEKMLA